MGWMWTCFGGKKERSRRIRADGRTRQRNRDRSSAQAPPPNLHSLGIQLKSPKEACAYEELFQPKQVVLGTPHGSKLFKRKPVRRAKSCGSSTAFENGAKKLLDKNVEARTIGRIDRLQEEVDGLRRRLAEEEEEARKLRHEVCYLRSCGVLQSPDRQRNSCGFGKETLLPRDDKGQQNLQSWLGLTLSPGSRFKLEEELRSMAADEISKVPEKGLTNGQKALIVATKLWRYQGDHHQGDQNKSELGKSSCKSEGSHGDTSGETRGENQLLLEEATISNRHDNATPYSGHQLMSSDQDPSFRDHLQFVDDSIRREATESSTPLSTSGRMENFSFHPSGNDDKTNGRHLSPEKTSVKAVPLLQRVPSCPEQMATSSFDSPKEPMFGKFPSSPSEKIKFESPRRSCSLPSVGSGSQTSDPDHVQARRFIDLRYQELEEKLLKSPKKETVSITPTLEDSPPRQSIAQLLDVVKHIRPEEPRVSEDVNSSEAPEFEASFNGGDFDTSSISVAKPFFACKSGRLWQPLSPVREVDSGRSSREGVESTSISQFNVSDSVDSSNASDVKSSVTSIISGSEWEQQDDFPHHHGDTGEVPDDDLFTLSPRRLHHSYNPWAAAHRFEKEVEDEWKMDLNAESGSGTGWASSDEADFDDLVPIQCQSPAFSPKQKFTRNKFVKGKALKVEEYPRDKYFKEIGFKVEEFLSSSESCGSTASGSSEKENRDGAEIPPGIIVEMDSPYTGKGKRNGTEILPGLNAEQVVMPGSLNEAAQLARKSLIANDVSLVQDCDYPVLSSIENLPKWIECHGVSASPSDNKQSQHQDTHISEREEIVSVQQDATSERPSLHCNSKASGEFTRQEEEGPIFRPVEELVLGAGHQQVKNDALPLDFSVRQGDHESSRQIGKSLEGPEAEKLRLSLHGFVYQDENAQDHRYPNSMEIMVQKQQHFQNHTEILVDLSSSPGRKGGLNSCLTKVGKGQIGASLAHSENDLNGERGDGQGRPTLDPQVSNEEHVVVFQESTQQKFEKKKMVTTDKADRHDVLSHIKSLGYNIQIPKLKYSFPDTEFTCETLSISGDSEVSRDADETFHDCESPTLSESNIELSQSNSSLAETNRDARIAKSRAVREEVSAAKRTIDISPDDRPILGTVATHWGENNPKSHRQWDGLGIPNSTSKFKEDQRVNWHSTPFETRLEQALAKMPTVPELGNQRRLFEGVA